MQDNPKPDEELAAARDGAHIGEINVPMPVAGMGIVTEDTFRQMWLLRYQQHMGHITLLELLDKYEEILGIPPRPISE